MATRQATITVPDIGNFSEVEIIDILVQPGDSVSAEDALITLESDKATMDIPSPFSGTVKELLISEGSHVSQGVPIIIMETREESDKNQEEESQSTPEPDSSPPPSTDSDDNKERDADEDHSPPPAMLKRRPPPTLPPPGQKAGVSTPHASPSVRKFARELGADLNGIRGTGTKGRILKHDIENFIRTSLSQESHPGEATHSGKGIPQIPEVDFSQFGEIETSPLSRIKKLSGPHLHRAWLNVPHVTHHDEVDVTEMEAFRRSLKDEAGQQNLRITPLLFVIKSLVAAMKTFPIFNASLARDGESLIIKHYFHIGIAVDTPNGLVVPVLRDVDRKSIFELAEELGNLSGRARDGKLSPADLQGGCMSISSLGGIGGSAFTPIINVPEVAILGVTRSRMQPIWNDDAFQPRLMMPLDLSYDHRVIDGAEAARFMSHLSTTLSDPRRLLL